MLNRLFSARRRARALVRSTLLAALLAACPGLLPAQVRRDSTVDDTTHQVLAPVTVRAERERSIAPPVATLRVPPVTLRTTPSADAFDLVRRTAGVEVHEQGQGPGYASNVVVRGFTSDHSADVLLVIDGVPINEPINGHGEGYADWNVLMPSAVSTMRIIYGTASPLYGNFALGGTAEVYTAADASGVAGGVSAWSDRGGGGWFRTGMRGPGGGSLVVAELRHDAGWRQHSASTVANALVRGWHAVAGGRAEGGVQLYRSAWDSPGFLSVAQFGAGDLTAAADATDGGASTRVIAHGRLAVPTSFGATLDATGWAQGGRLHFFLNIPEGTAPPAQTEELDRRTAVGGQAQLTWPRATGEVTLGASARADHARYDKFNTTARQRDDRELGFDADYAEGGAFVRWRRRFGPDFGVDAGARVDAVRYTSGDLVNATSASRTRAIASPKLGVRYLLPDGEALFGSVSRGYRAAVGVIGDPSREPYLAWSSEIGLERIRAAYSLTVSLFRLDVSNERIQDPVTLVVSSAGHSVRQGLSGTITMRPADRLTLSAEGTWNDAKLSGTYVNAHVDASRLDGALSPGEIGPPLRHETGGGNEALLSGQRVPGVARYTARAGATFRLGLATLVRASVRVMGDYFPIGEPTEPTSAYAVLDLGAAIPVGGDGWQLEVALQNALDRRYAELRASEYITPGTPRMLRVAMQFRP